MKKTIILIILVLGIIFGLYALLNLKSNSQSSTATNNEQMSALEKSLQFVISEAKQSNRSTFRQGFYGDIKNDEDKLLTFFSNINEYEIIDSGLKNDVAGLQIKYILEKNGVLIPFEVWIDFKMTEGQWKIMPDSIINLMQKQAKIDQEVKVERSFVAIDDNKTEVTLKIPVTEENFIIYEKIPKSVIKSASDVEFYFPHIIVEDDPIIATIAFGHTPIHPPIHPPTSPSHITPSTKPLPHINPPTKPHTPFPWGELLRRLIDNISFRPLDELVIKYIIPRDADTVNEFGSDFSTVTTWATFEAVPEYKKVCLSSKECGESRKCQDGSCICQDDYFEYLGECFSEDLLPEQSEETAGWQTYRNEEYGFEIKYPNGWEIGVSEDLSYSYYSYNLRIFNSEVDKKAKEAQEKFGGSEWSPYINGIDISVVKKEKSLDEFIEDNYNDDATGGYDMGGSKLISKTNIILPNGMQAVDVVCEAYGMCGATLLESNTHIFDINDFCFNGGSIGLTEWQKKDFYEFDTRKECEQILATFKFFDEANESQSGSVKGDSDDLTEDFLTFSTTNRRFVVQYPDWPRDTDVESDMDDSWMIGLKAVAKPNDAIIIMMVDGYSNIGDIVSDFEKVFEQDKEGVIQLINKKIIEKGAFIEFVIKDENAFGGELPLDVGHLGLRVINQSFYYNDDKDDEAVFVLFIFVAEDKWPEYQEVINHTLNTMQVGNVLVNKYILDY